MNMPHNEVKQSKETSIRKKYINSFTVGFISTLIIGIVSYYGYQYYKQMQPIDCFYVATQYANLRTEPSTSNETKISRISRNEKVCVFDKKYSSNPLLKSVWYKAKYNGHEGWVSSVVLAKEQVKSSSHSCSLSDNTSKYYYEGKEDLMIRSSFDSKEQNIIGYIKPRQSIICSSQNPENISNGFLELKMQDQKKGWVQKENLKKSTCIQININELSVYKAPDYNSEVLNTLSTNQTACILDKEGGSNWAKVNSNRDNIELVGYIDLNKTNFNEVTKKEFGRYTVYQNGTVVDKYTDVMWTKCSLGQSWNGERCSGEPQKYSWLEALQALEKLNRQGFAGFNTWELPHIQDLYTLVQCTNGFKSKYKIPMKRGFEKEVPDLCKDNFQKPTINTAVFGDTISGTYWSSSPYKHDSSDVWISRFDKGDSYYMPKENKYYVRLSRQL